jgi:hypothetical protein
MADDRHEAYRMLFGTTELSRLFSKYGESYPTGYIAYRLLEIKHEHPDSSVAHIIQLAIKFFEDERTARKDNQN